MTQGERDMAVETSRLLHRQELRIRTVAVSFEAAVSSAHRDFEMTASERDATIEVWRSWTLGHLDTYRSELDDLRVEHPELADELDELAQMLTASIDAVRRA
jgi:hypothetical protein